jgi:HD-GYP domain-containing protein (c-di-GMP phosphodiesterase class II)
VADTYDAMTSDRAYRSALSHEIAVAELKRCAATQFDPRIVAVFIIEMERYRKEKQEEKEDQKPQSEGNSDQPGA